MRLLPARFVSVFLYAMLLMPVSVAAQDVTDTLYYDIKWQLCEKVPAYYYRIGTMRIDSIAWYVGPVADYYRSGQLEMTSFYTKKGDLHGETVFYYANGNTRMKGKYTNGKMTGQWFLYDSSGVLRAILECKSDTDFTPLFLCNKKGKVLLKDGNGKFLLETKEFDSFFQPGYEIEGVVRNGQKDEVWEYSTSLFASGYGSHSQRVFLSEHYVRGKFIRALTNPYGDVEKSRILDKPFSKVSLAPAKVLTLDMLKSDIVFAPTLAGRYQLKPFLLLRKTPVIEQDCTSADQNFGLYLSTVCTALMKKEELAFKGHSLPGKSYSGYSYEIIRLGPYFDKKNRYKASIRFTILPDRRIGNLAIEGKIDERSRELIAYYLLKLRGLYVNPNAQQSNVELKLETTFPGMSRYMPVIELSRNRDLEPD